MYIGSSPCSVGVSTSAWGVSEVAAYSCFIAWLAEGGGMSLGVCAGGDAGSSGSAAKMCCRELILATSSRLPVAGGWIGVGAESCATAMGGCARGSCSRAEASLVVSCFDQSGSGRMRDGLRNCGFGLQWYCWARTWARKSRMDEEGLEQWLGAERSTGEARRFVSTLICSQSTSVL